MQDDTQVEGTPVTTAETITPAPSQTPVEQEIEREKGKQQRSEKEKAEFSLRSNAKRAQELGIDPAEVLGLKKPEIEDGDDAPATMGAVKQMLAEKEKQSAYELAEQIQDVGIRELTKLNLKKVVPSGDAKEDLRFAQMAAEAARSAQVLEEVARAGRPATHVSAAGAPGAHSAPEPELSKDEMQFLRPPFSLTKEQIIAARPKA